MRQYAVDTPSDPHPHRGPPGRRSGPDAEHELILAAAAGDTGARGDLVEAFMPLIGGVARLYRNAGAVERAELMQEGVVGLLNALQRYDPDRGTPFWGYASWWVRQSMQSLVARSRSPVVLSDRALRQLARVKDARTEHLQAQRREPTTAEVAAATGLAVMHVQRLLAADGAARPLDEPTAPAANSATTIGELVADPRAQDDFDGVVQQLAADAVGSLPGDLSNRERTIVRARYGLGCRPQTLREVAGRMGVSAERVRQLEVKALAKIRDAADVATEPILG